MEEVAALLPKVCRGATAATERCSDLRYCRLQEPNTGVLHFHVTLSLVNQLSQHQLTLSNPIFMKLDKQTQKFTEQNKLLETSETPLLAAQPAKESGALPVGIGKQVVVQGHLACRLLPGSSLRNWRSCTDRLVWGWSSWPPF